MKFLKDYVRKICEDEVRAMAMRLVGETMDARMFALDPEKLYILVVPTSISDLELTKVFEQYKDRTDLIILRADEVSLLELS